MGKHPSISGWDWVSRSVLLGLQLHCDFTQGWSNLFGSKLFFPFWGSSTLSSHVALVTLALTTMDCNKRYTSGVSSCRTTQGCKIVWPDCSKCQICHNCASPPQSVSQEELEELQKHVTDTLEVQAITIDEDYDTWHNQRVTKSRGTTLYECFCWIVCQCEAIKNR